MSEFCAELKKYGLFIDGVIRGSSDSKTFESVDPSTGEVFAELADANLEDIQAAIQSARTVHESRVWQGMDISQRGSCLVKIANIIRENARELAELESLDTGKTSKQTTFIDVPTCADTFEYFGKVQAPLISEDIEVAAPVRSLLRREPMGVVGCIIPWNYPLIMMAWKVAPALLAGNAIVFRPSSQASVAIMRLASLIVGVGLPKGVLNFVSTSKHDVVNELVKSPLVGMVSFTGGTDTGKDIMRLAADTTKKLTLELGGKSPNIVFADCDVDIAVGGTMSAIFMNQGQMCTAGSRLLVEESIYEQFIEKLVAKTRGLKIGPSMDYETDFGPLISKRHRDEVLSFIDKGVKEGATLLCGGGIPQGEELAEGFYLEPAIFTDVKNSMAIAQEEVFGPVLSVLKFKDKEEAIKIANDSKFGLAACIWTKDLDKANDVARQLESGTVWINTYGGFYNEASYGGFKQSGFGRELGRDGLFEFTQTKHVCIDNTPGGQPLVSGWF